MNTSLNATYPSVNNPDSDVFASPVIQSHSVSRSSDDTSTLNGSVGGNIVASQSLEPGTFRRGSDGPVYPVKDGEGKPVVYKKLEHIKAWSLNTMKCTKQILEEKLGSAIPTCDAELDLRVETLKQMQRHYQQLLDYARSFTNNLTKTVQAQRQLAGHLASLEQQQPELIGEFSRNARLQRAMVRNGDKLLCALEVVCNALSTLVNQTIGDTMLTIRNMNTARIEFDAYRKEAEIHTAAPPRANQNDPVHNRRTEAAVTRFQQCEANFLRLKSAVDVKLRLLHENRIRVMQHNLLLFNDSVSAYYTGDENKLDQTLKLYNIKAPSPLNSPELPSNTPTRHIQMSATSPHDAKSPVRALANGSQTNGH